MFFQDLLSVSLVKFVNDSVQMFSIFIDFFLGGWNAGIAVLLLSMRKIDCTLCEFLCLGFCFIYL